MKLLCCDCPRNCHALREEHRPGGVCASPLTPHIVRAAPHFGEEPCISGSRGSGAIFFSGCNLKCVFCQNQEISRAAVGKAASVTSLRDIMLRLRDQGVHNINLVTGTHYTRTLAKALDGLELGIPVVWNSSGYEKPETLRMLEGLVQIYMPDYKYARPQLAQACSSAGDYPQVASAAIREMYRQTGPYVMDDEGLLCSGLLIRHLILPGQCENTMDVIDFAADQFPPDTVLFSLMSQYTPMPGAEAVPSLTRRLSEEEGQNMRHYMLQRHISCGYWQDVDSSGKEQIPSFDGTGIF